MKLKFTLSLLSFVLVFFASINVLQAQGPDDYGYTWKDSNSPDGPTYNWVDIVSDGVEINGLADDNSVAFVPMGLNFQFYWSEYNQIKIGSNGWLSFDNVSNISHCFPDIPSTAANNNLVCPLMGDINFAGGANPGKIYTYNDGAGRFIISYHNCGFWVNASPDYTGDNTFQVILDSNDSSITFQYQTMDAALANPTDACNQDVVIGIENSTGSIGLKVLNDAMPPSNYAIKFTYPETVTLDVPDIAPAWNQNPENGGEFYLPSDAIELTASVENAGNVDVNSNISVTATLLSLAGDLVFVDDATLGSLDVGQSQDVNFGSVTTPASQYAYEIETGNEDDINNVNNSNITEINVVDVSGATVSLNYATGAPPTNGMQWSGGATTENGGGVYIIPPVYPTTIEGVDAYIITGSTDGYTLVIRDDDGINGAPGTVLASATVAAGAYTADAWNMTMFDETVEINDGGFYVGWLMGGDVVGLGTEIGQGPISRRSYEIIAGAWAEYRTASTADLLLGAVVTNDYPVTSNQDILLEKSIAVYPNPTQDVVEVNVQLENEVVEVIEVFNTLGESVFVEAVNLTATAKHQLDLSAYPSGIYYVNFTVGANKVTKKVSLIK